MSDSKNYHTATGPLGGSYWTKRRKIVKSVDKIMEESSDFDIESNLTEEQYVRDFAGCATSETASCSISCIPEQQTCSSFMSEPYLNNFVCDDEDNGPYTDESDVSDACSFTSDSSSENDLCDKLSQWALNFNIPKEAVKDLLNILHTHHPDLPLDARTLLKTPHASDYQVKVIGEGSYYHFGISNSLKTFFENGDLKPSEVDGKQVLQLQINVDGLPLYKSTNYQLWPILGMVVNNVAKVPFVIGMFGGPKKPGTIFDYLCDFVRECQTLEDKGILFGSHTYGFQIHSIMCDAPARAFVRNTKGHNAYYGCDRCTQSGHWLNKMTFPEVSAQRRTDTDFRAKVCEDYHIGDTPLTCLSINLISQLPLDYMHLVCLGVVRKLILAWLKGPLNCRLPAKSVCDISDRLSNLRLYMPSEFCRRPRSLSDIDRYKATEFRQILLYTGVVVFRDILPDQLYQHFMLLSCAMYCCLSSRLCYMYCEFANKLLVSFVEYAEKVYGTEFLVYNVH